MVQAFLRQIAPYGAIFLFIQNTADEPLLYKVFAEQVRVAFVLNLVEINAQSLVGLGKTVVHPTVHFLPELSHIFVFLFPVEQHLLCLFDTRCFFFGAFLTVSLSYQVGDFFFIFFIEGYIVIAHEFVAFHPCGRRCFILAGLLPGEHGFADMNAAVVDDLCFDHIVAIFLQDFGHGIAEQIVADVPEVQRFIGVR